MHTFLLDLWQDLREKRLWPIAALLIVATAAVPFVLIDKSQPAPAAPAPNATQAQTAADKLPTVTLDNVTSKTPSDLTEFAQRNPFKPLKDLPAKDKSKTVTTTPKGSGSGSGTGTGTGTGTGSGTGSGSGSGGTAAPAAPAAPVTAYYTYRPDIRFGAPGKEKTSKQVESFTLLGDEKEPAAMFMGITDDQKFAVFTVDTARYESNGEHECKPTPERCDFIYLKVAGDGNETTLTSLDGSKTYNLELLAIKRITLDKKAVETVPKEQAKSDASKAGKRDAVDIVPRSLFDIISQTR